MSMALRHDSQMDMPTRSPSNMDHMLLRATVAGAVSYLKTTNVNQIALADSLQEALDARADFEPSIDNGWFGGWPETPGWYWFCGFRRPASLDSPGRRQRDAQPILVLAIGYVSREYPHRIQFAGQDGTWWLYQIERIEGVWRAQDTPDLPPCVPMPEAR